MQNKGRWIILQNKHFVIDILKHDDYSNGKQ